MARGKREPALSPDPTGRTRGRGRHPKPLSATDPGLLDALDTLVDPDTRGDPHLPLRWTTKSLRQLADALFQAGHPVSPTIVGAAARPGVFAPAHPKDPGRRPASRP